MQFILINNLLFQITMKDVCNLENGYVFAVHQSISKAKNIRSFDDQRTMIGIAITAPSLCNEYDVYYCSYTMDMASHLYHNY